MYIIGYKDTFLIKKMVVNENKFVILAVFKNDNFNFM